MKVCCFTGEVWRTDVGKMKINFYIKLQRKRFLSLAKFKPNIFDEIPF